MEDGIHPVPVSVESSSPYDPDYPAKLLAHGLQEQRVRAEKAMESIYRAAIKLAPDVAQLREASKKGFRLVVDATDSTLKDIERGSIR